MIYILYEMHAPIWVEAFNGDRKDESVKQKRA